VVVLPAAGRAGQEPDRLSPPCRCQATHLGAPVDVAAHNRAAEQALRAGLPGEREVDCLILPGFTPRLGPGRDRLHPLIEGTCRVAARDLAAGVAGLIIPSGGAVHGPANEAVLMRKELLELGVPEDRILIEPCARHTTTNLRNAGRLMLAHGLRTAYVVAADAGEGPLAWLLLRYLRQSAYVGFPRASSFALRCRLTLGYQVGQLAWVRPQHVFFVPSPRVVEDSPRATAEGDP